MAPNSYNAHELLAIAREMEQEGLAFYKAIAKQVSDPDAKALFLRLASDEAQHIRDLEKLEKKADEYFPSEEDNLVAQYMQGAVDTGVFPTLAEVPEIAASVNGIAKAIDIGIGAEKRAMDFYAKAVTESPCPVAARMLERLRDMEEDHLKQLNVLRRNYG